MSIDPKAVTGFLGAMNPVAAGLALVLALVVLAIAWRAGRGITRAVQRGLRDKRPEDVITLVYSAMATAVAAEGMLNFFGAKLAMPLWMRALTFCMFELGMLGCALRARRKIRDEEIGTAGIDGKLVWVLAIVSGLLSSTAASGWGIFARLIIPLFAAGGWELLLAYERRRSGRSKINWRWTPEKILVRLGMAEASGRTAGEDDTLRRLKRAAIASRRLRVLRAAGASDARLRRAEGRAEAAMRGLVQHTDFATNDARQDELVSMIAALNGATSLAEISPVAPWNRPDPVVAVFEDARFRFAPLIAGAPDTGTEERPELGTGTGTENRSEAPTGTGTEVRSGTGSDTGSGDGTDAGSGAPPNTGTRRRRSTGSRTGTRKGRGTDRATLLQRARELNDEHFREHGKPISGDKLASALSVNKTKALDLLREVKRLREVRSEDGAA